MPAIDLNADLGEGRCGEVDEALLALVTSANVACGGHTGDLDTMRRTVKAALELGVRIGAHPSYPDRENFGRVTLEIPAAALVSSIVEQVRSLVDVARAEGVQVEYFKPHGALYNDAAWDPGVGQAAVEAAAALSLPLMMLAGSPLARAAAVPIIREGFIDRGYREDGSLIPRSEDSALVTDPDRAARQAVALASSVDSLCVHSDTPGALQLLRAAREALETAGYEIAAR